jgi:FkbM family methyltransferase
MADIETAHGQPFDLQALLGGARHDNESAIRSRCQNAFLGNETSLCRVLGRYKMFVDTADASLSAHLLLDGYWKMWTTEAMLYHLKPGDIAVDIGANLGYFTLLMADIVGPAGRVHAFEPNPSIAARLERSVAINGFGGMTSVYRLGLADRGGEAGLAATPGEPKNAHLVDRPPVDGDDAVPMVAVQRLDTLGIAPDVIKFDIEGGEEAAWRGLAGVLAQRRPLTVFLQFAGARYADPALFLDEILRHGFSLAVIDHRDGVRPLGRAEVLAAAIGAEQMLVLKR